MGIGDLVYASTYWAQDNRWVNEYSEYMQYVNSGSPPNLAATYQQSYTCLTDPFHGSGYGGCKVPIQYYNYRNNVDRWSNELRLQSKEGGRVRWLAGAYWEKTRELLNNYYHMPGLQTAGEAWLIIPAHRSQGFQRIVTTNSSSS